MRECRPSISRFIDAANKFIDTAVTGKKPFFVWFNTTRMHVWTHLKPSAEGRTGISIYADGMVEHDDMVGGLLKRLDDLGIADNTIVVYGTDNGAEEVTWPDGGTMPFRGEKGTTWEGGFRVPMLVRWPGVIKPGTIVNQIFSQEDWLPTLLAAAGEPDIVEKLKTGYEANGKAWKVHSDGYNFLPFFKGETPKGPREEIYYFGQGGDLNAIRWNDWKVSFATEDGNIATAVRNVPGWPVITNLRADPYERASSQSGMYIRWYADNIWLFVPVQEKLKAFLSTLAGISVPTGKQPERRGHQLQLPSGDPGDETPQGIGISFVAEQLSGGAMLTTTGPSKFAAAMAVVLLRSGSAFAYDATTFEKAELAQLTPQLRSQIEARMTGGQTVRGITGNHAAEQYIAAVCRQSRRRD